uniref:NADH-ubiquinone oxidoreductase chain 4 n=1 Tax=Mytilus trossulus TaxID=6551 RepID=A9X3B5_MYTTR|nr:NADH dehydrogenase subunit 4 [Mytilus trossulus]AII78550.1 NADH dehydrogenase subunit 4 [Mytilus trossulus]AII78615.1 NADH dehydrogenase subunit 4 [Mytilus trossulus]
MVKSLAISLIALIIMKNLNVSIIGLSVLTILSMGAASVATGGVELNGLYSTDFVMGLMITLTLFVAILSYLSSAKVSRKASFNLMVISISLILVMSFSVSSFFLFFFFFESVLAPLLLLIVGWGYQPERLQAGGYMVIYTVFGSLFFLWGVSELYLSGMSSSMSSVGSLVKKSAMSLWWLYILGFLIKLPMYPFHLWLPKAHVEAPVAGSMLLAGVVLKLGGYGLLRFMLVMQVSLSSVFFVLLLSVNLAGGFYAGLACVRQVDLKCLVAYSSVAHMSLVLLGVLSNTLLGVMGAIIIMVGHGLCSSGLFSYVNAIYKMSHSRLLVMNKGGLLFCPVLVLMCFLLSSSNMAAPPSLNLFGEILVFGVGGWMSGAFLFILGLMSFISACFSLYLYGSCSHGKGLMHSESLNLSSLCDVFVLLSHWVPLNFLFMFMP